MKVPSGNWLPGGLGHSIIQGVTWYSNPVMSGHRREE